MSNTDLVQVKEIFNEDSYDHPEDISTDVQFDSTDIDDCDSVEMMELIDEELKNHVVRTDLNLGSLMRLFKSSYFDTWMNIVYLYKCKDNRGVIAYLCNELYKRDKHDIENYLPQLCNFLKLEFYKPVLRFLIDLCCNNIHFALKITWLVDALLYSEEPTEREFYIKIRDEVHIAILNGRTSLQYNTMLSEDENIDPLELAMKRIYRCEYYNNMILFTKRLVTIGDLLIKVKENDRFAQLESELQKINDMITKFPGLYIPLYNGSDQFHSILNIAIRHSVLLTSATRVPFLLWAEVKELPDVYTSDENIFAVAQESGLVISHNMDVIPVDSVEEVTNDSAEEHEETRFKLDPNEDQKKQIHAESHYSQLHNWNVYSLIVKFGDDCVQERFAIQLIGEFDVIFRESNLPIYLRPYHMLILSPNSCLIETLPNVLSLHQLKDKHEITILEYLTSLYGNDTKEFDHARRNFVESLAGYSIVCYLLQLKDRHNGNILIDTEGHLMHIDFGFMLSNSPGKNMGFEQAPFKLTNEYVEVLGGEESGLFFYYKALLLRGMQEAKKHHEKIVRLVQMMQDTSPDMECFYDKRNVIKELTKRFRISLTDHEFEIYVDRLVSESLDNWHTNTYDLYQNITGGIRYN